MMYCIEGVKCLIQVICTWPTRGYIVVGFIEPLTFGYIGSWLSSAVMYSQLHVAGAHNNMVHSCKVVYIINIIYCL